MLMQANAEQAHLHRLPEARPCRYEEMSDGLMADGKYMPLILVFVAELRLTWGRTNRL